jgi:hypothetical protein
MESMKRLVIVAALVSAAAFALQQQHIAVDERGDHVMGFSHEKTTHHFRLYPDGGAIEVNANDAADTQSRDQIRMHLGHIAKMFADGDFNAPMLVHDRIPPGASVLQKRKAQVQYRFKQTERGAVIRITTKDPDAMQALYAFLRFQIAEHRTGDPTVVTR